MTQMMIRHAFLIAFIASLFGHARAAELDASCARFDIAGTHFIYVTDANFHRLLGTTIPLGDIDLSGDSVETKKFFVVASKDLEPQAALGGRELVASVAPVHQGCSRVNVASIAFSFDGSSLPPGAFTLAYSFFGKRSDGAPDIEAKASQVSGVIHRIWVQPSIDRSGNLHLENTGNVDAPAFSFGDVPKGFPLVVTENQCEAKALWQHESCEIKVRSNSDGINSTAVYAWPVSYLNSSNELSLSLSFSNGQMLVASRNN